MACKRCVEDNICKVKDDFFAFAEKIKQAETLVVGGYCPYSSLDGFTKSFMVRLLSPRHFNNLLGGKIAITVVTGLTPEIRDRVSEMIAREMLMERMDVIGHLKVEGNLPCLTCGKGDTSEMSRLPPRFGEKAKASVDKCVQVEDQKAVWEEAQCIGQRLQFRIKKK